MQTNRLTHAVLLGAVSLAAPLVAEEAVSSDRVGLADSFFARAGVAWFDPIDLDGYEGEAGTWFAFGRDFGPDTLEIEAGYAEFSEDDGVPSDWEFIPVTVGYRYNFALGRRLSVGLGLNTGLAFTEYRLGGAEDTDVVWIASALARVGFALTERLGLSAGYRYIHVDDPTYFGGRELEDAGTQVIDLGLEFRW